jgi:hypothetical protein
MDGVKTPPKVPSFPEEEVTDAESTVRGPTGRRTLRVAPCAAGGFGASMGDVTRWIAVALMLSACGGPQPTPPPAANAVAGGEAEVASPYDPVAALSVGAPLVVHVQVDALRRSPAWPDVQGLLRSLVDTLRQREGVDGFSAELLELLGAWVLVAVDDIWVSAEEGSSIVVLQGAGIGVPPAMVEDGPLSLGRPGSQLTVGAPTGGDLWVLGATADVEGALARMEEGRGTFARPPAWGALEGGAGAVVTVRYAGSAEARRRLLDSFEVSGETMGDLVIGVSEASLTVRFTDAIDVAGEIRFRDEARAMEAERMAQEMLQGPVAGLIAAMTQMPFLDSVTLTREGEVVSGTVDVPMDVLRDLARQVGDRVSD